MSKKSLARRSARSLLYLLFMKKLSKPQKKNLQLSTETLRKLDRAELPAVSGGRPMPTSCYETCGCPDSVDVC